MGRKLMGLLCLAIAVLAAAGVTVAVHPLCEPGGIDIAHHPLYEPSGLKAG
ncbi:MAG: hypothetical protein V3T72_00380 [Thermoanaerobaculia bacterium]